MPRPRVPIAGTFGQWTVLEQLSAKKIRCRCSCGFVGFVAQDNLRNGVSTRCRKCYGSSKRGKPDRRVCPVCSAIYFTSPSSQKGYCSDICRKKAAARPRGIDPEKHEILLCKSCGKTFSMLRSQLEKSNASGRFCSKNCYSLWQTTQGGEQNPQYSRIDVECFECSRPIKRIKSKQELYPRAFCSRRCKGRFFSRHWRGSKSPCYREGSTRFRGEEWPSIRAKTIKAFPECAICGSTKRRHVHHIIPYRLTQDNSQENLVTLCLSHHRTVELYTNQIENLLDLDPRTVLLTVNERLAAAGSAIVRPAHTPCLKKQTSQLNLGLLIGQSSTPETLAR